MSEITGLHLKVRGIVQGVGFRPFVYNLATRLGLTGWVRNTSSGVEIELNGPQATLDAFLQDLKKNPPILAHIDEVQSQACTPNGRSSFEIISSQPQPGEFIPISPDVAVCADCQRELFDPADRRYRYPFINCINCGPRFTIIQDIPYDRSKTTMAGFRLCPECEAEYHNPAERRFHAQPVACPDCGPQVWFEAQGKRLSESEDAIQLARRWLQDGKILAVKGLGGYHLACDATNPAAVAELRRRKHRNERPFALMVFDLAAAKRYCDVAEPEKALLTSPAHPIMLLNRRPESQVAAEVAPRQPALGVMLAYTPLHLLLLEPQPGFPDVLVMTSGNLSEEPIAYQDDDAHERLDGLADGFLLHNRPIHIRVDDSVVRVAAGGPYFLRRSRGFAPNPVRLAEIVPPILATGGELKNVFCLTRHDYAFLSHHIGDLENFETLLSFEEGVAHFERLFRIQPEALACDLHPDYLASRYARERAARQSLPLVEVQHHHAHLAACLAENGWTASEPVIGLSFDGTGYGPDGAIWGSEVLLGGYNSCERLYHLTYVPLPGGDLAVHRPARMALAHLWQAGLDWDADLPPVIDLCYEERTALRSQLEYRINSPLTSSMGRLFDAAAALIGIRQTVTYEGQAAIEMEALADPAEKGVYTFDVRSGLVNPAPVLEALVADWRAGLSLPRLAARFHNSLVQLILDLCQAIRSDTSASTVAFSGGVWQNRFLLEHTLPVLQLAGFRVLIHRQVPANDGGLALGQALIAIKSITSQ